MPGAPSTSLESAIACAIHDHAPLVSVIESGSISPFSPVTATFSTVIRFTVSVPVLSVQMNVVEPSVSTAGRRRRVRAS